MKTMNKYDFHFENGRKLDFFFPDDFRPGEEFRVGETRTLKVTDKAGKIYELEFKIRRNTYFQLSEKRWIYGALIYGEGGYAQLEIRLNNRDPREDTIEVFPSAPPVGDGSI